METILVRIKTWDQMVSEFGYFNETHGEKDTIDTPSGWTIPMENELPEDRIIRIFEDKRGDLRWDTGRPYPYYIDPDMIDDFLD